MQWESQGNQNQFQPQGIGSEWVETTIWTQSEDGSMMQCQDKQNFDRESCILSPKQLVLADGKDWTT